MLTQPPYQALGEDAVDGGGQQIILDPHVQQAGDSAGRVIGVQGGEYHVSGEGGLDGDAGGLQVAHLADHDDVGVLTDDGAQGAGKGHADGGFDLNLVDARELVLHRVLDRDDLGRLGIEA